MSAHKHFSIRDPGYRASYFSNNHDNATPIKVVITTPATGSYQMAMDVSAHQTVHVSILEDITVDTAGDTLIFRNRNRQGDHPDDCECTVQEIGSGGAYSGGTEILTKVEQRGEPGIHIMLKQSTSYQITVTSKGDDNWTSVMVWVWQGSGPG